MARSSILGELVLPCVVVVVSLVLAACAGSSDRVRPAGQCSSDPIETAGILELDDGVLNIGSSIDYPPIEFYDESGTLAGLDVDLAEALGNELCVDVSFVDTPFEALSDSLRAGKFDVILSAMTITPERSQLIDFVPYANVGTSMIVREGNPQGIRERSDLCGKAVAVQIATIHEDLLRDESRQCSGGEGEIDVLTFDSSANAVRDVVTAGSDATLTDFPAAFVYVEEADGRLELIDVQICPQPYGVGVRYASSALSTAVKEALVRLHGSGAYEEAMKTWDLGNAALNLTEVLDGESGEIVSECSSHDGEVRRHAQDARHDGAAVLSVG